MNEGVLTPLSYVAATVVSDELVFVLAQIDDLNAQEVDHTKVLRWKNGQWGHFMIDFATTRIVHERREGALGVLSMGVYGEVHVFHVSKLGPEEVDPSRDGPMNRGVLRDLRIIEGKPVVCGMQRQVYIRATPGQWDRMDSGVVMPLGSQDIRGFNSIDGLSRRDVYAAGLEGEIWHYDGTLWTAMDSPTSNALQKVCCHEEQDVFIAGIGGVLLRGRGNAWVLVDLGSFRETIWDLCWFQGRLFIAASRSLLVMEPSGAVRPVDVGLPDHWSFGQLATNGSVLWSIGQKHLARTMDGLHWISEACMDGSY